MQPKTRSSRLNMMAFCSEHPKWVQNPKFTIFLSFSCNIIWCKWCCEINVVVVVECFHMTSRGPYWCPKTIKRRHVDAQTSPEWVKLFSYANAFFCPNKFAKMLATWVKTLYYLTCDIHANVNILPLKVIKCKSQKYYYHCFSCECQCG